MKKITMFFAAMLFALVAFAEPTTVTVDLATFEKVDGGRSCFYTADDFRIEGINVGAQGFEPSRLASGHIFSFVPNEGVTITKILLNYTGKNGGSVIATVLVGKTYTEGDGWFSSGNVTSDLTVATVTTSNGNATEINVNGEQPTLYVGTDKELYFTSIEVTYEVAAQEEPAGPVEVTTMDELKAHAGETVIYKGLEPTVVKMGWETMTLMPDGETMLYCELTYTLPARFDAKGIYSAEEGMFAVQEFVAIYAFNTVSDLNMFLQTSNPTEEQKAAAYEIKSSFVVTYIDGNFGKIYAQYEGTDPYMGRPMTCGIELGWAGIAPRSGEAIANPGMLVPGDEILVSGVYSPAQYDEEYNLTAAESFVANTITRVSQNNALKATALSAIEEGTYSYVSGYVMINNVAVANSEAIPGAWTITDSYDASINVVQCGPNTDLSEYVGKTLDKYLVGVLAYQPAVGGYIFYAIDFKESKEYFDNIAALIAAGPSNGGISSALRNPVVVNYIYYNQWAGYTLFVEDATGVLVVKGVGVMDEDGNYTFPYEVEAGDSILGINGFLEEGSTMFTGIDYNIDVNLTYVSEGVVNEIDVTLEALLADQEAWQEASWNGEAYASPYANRVVKVTDLTLEETDDDATAYWVQGESKLEFNPKLWAQLEMEVPANVAALTGIADYNGIWNYSFTIIPTAVEAAGETVNVELVEVANVYSENGLIVAEGEFQIFTVTGQNVTDMNGNLEGGVYVVRTANATAKVIVK